MFVVAKFVDGKLTEIVTHPSENWERTENQLRAWERMALEGAEFRIGRIVFEEVR